MSNTTLALSAVFSLVTSALYIYMGNVLRRRQVSDDAKLAQSMFVLWWQSLGYLGLLGVVILVVYAAGALEIWVYNAYVTLVLGVLFLALWGLQFYLVYLYTGSRKSFAPLGVFYALLFMAFIALIERIGSPERITDNGWTLRTEPEADFGPAFSLGFVLLIVGPQIVAALAYARLYRKTSDRTQKYRIALVTGSILVWFGSSIFATALQLSEDLSWQLVSRLIGVAGALVILMAYMPPQWIREKYGIRSIVEEGQAPLGTVPA